MVLVACIYFVLNYDLMVMFISYNNINPSTQRSVLTYYTDVFFNFYLTRLCVNKVLLKAKRIYE